MNIIYDKDFDLLSVMNKKWYKNFIEILDQNITVACAVFNRNVNILDKDNLGHYKIEVNNKTHLLNSATYWDNEEIFTITVGGTSEDPVIMLEMSTDFSNKRQEFLELNGYDVSGRRIV